MKNKAKLEYISINFNLTPVLTSYFIYKTIKSLNIVIREVKEEKEKTEE